MQRYYHLYSNENSKHAVITIVRLTLSAILSWNQKETFRQDTTVRKIYLYT